MGTAVDNDIYTAKLIELANQLADREREIEILQAQLNNNNQIVINVEQPKKSIKKHDVSPEENTYSDFKSDGKRKPHPADSIRSYSDFKAIQDYFMAKNDIRDWTMWTMGVALGLRISDLLSLKFKNVISSDRSTPLPRIQIYEQKTGKRNNCLITEAVQRALYAYLGAIKWHFDMDGWLFPSKKTGGKMYEEHGWRILSRAGRDLKLPLNIGSHTMRKSFANIAACVDKSSVDMNVITKIQGLLNHSDQKTTMKYLGTFNEMYDRARVAVSDFVLGRTNIDTLIAGGEADNAFDKWEELERKIYV